MGTVSLQQIFLQPQHGQSLRAPPPAMSLHIYIARPIMPPPTAIQTHTYNEQQLLNPSSHHKTAFQYLANSDIEGEVADVKHGNDDNIDKPCACQEEPVLFGVSNNL
jgi:hypothetical protein